MNNDRPNEGDLAELQAHPLDLRGLAAPDAARALYEFLQKRFEPGDECSLWSPVEAKSRGYSPFWRVSWEVGPVEWGALLTLGESMWLQELELGYEHRPEVLLQSGVVGTRSHISGLTSGSSRIRESNHSLRSTRTATLQMG